MLTPLPDDNMMDGWGARPLRWLNVLVCGRCFLDVASSTKRSFAKRNDNFALQRKEAKTIVTRSFVSDFRACNGQVHCFRQNHLHWSVCGFSANNIKHHPLFSFDVCRSSQNSHTDWPTWSPNRTCYHRKVCIKLESSSWKEKTCFTLHTRDVVLGWFVAHHKECFDFFWFSFTQCEPPVILSLQSCSCTKGIQRLLLHSSAKTRMLPGENRVSLSEVSSRSHFEAGEMCWVRCKKVTVRLMGNDSSCLCEVHLWSEHLAVMAILWFRDVPGPHVTLGPGDPPHSPLKASKGHMGNTHMGGSKDVTLGTYLVLT